MSNLYLANALILVNDNLTLAVKIIECAEEAGDDFSPKARQGIARAHAGLAMATQGMEYEELQAMIMQSNLIE
ncbi:hypothetical protein [Acaryochloris marina]|uniref:Uncharacterized protein n=1 Tax=Acaryochloris marina (strain MBIC 11017) TaxID=329726 RepID=A8ZMN2_ACAM1|nr:hypothetical protein [Acaryochloris marina]ABW32443.1 hypothetical protein AM1_C0136 [Acaryochloris marina MBIC11017]